MPAVSVIIATYNHADYLAAAVSSVLAQRWSDYELFIVDDGSTDRTPVVLDGLSKAHPGRLAFERTANRGVGAAMNTGLARTSGELVAFLDSDDLWTPNHLSTIVPMLTNDPSAVLAFGRREAIDAHGRRVDRPDKPWTTGQVTDDLFRSMFISKICMIARRDAIARAGRFDEALRMGEDYELMLRLSRLGPFLGTDAIVAHRRRHGSNLTADTPAYRVRTAALLERFYFRLDGWKDIDPVIARARLARVHYSAGKRLLAGGDAPAARFHLQRSIRYARRPKSRFFQIAAMLAPFARRNLSPELPEDYAFLPIDDALARLDEAERQTAP